MSAKTVPANGTGVTVNLTKQMTGARPAVVLEWGSRTFGVTLKTNGSRSRLTVTPVSLVGGVAISTKDVRISFSAPADYAIDGNTIRRDGKTAKAGDTLWITVSVWQPIGSPTVYLAYDYKARDASGVYR